MPLPEPAATRSVLAPAPWSRWLWVGLAAVAALTALDVAVDRQVVLAGALAAVALAVGLLGHRGDALVVGAAALVAALGATAWDAGDATEQAIAIAVTATAGVTAFVTAVLRDAAAASARQFALLRGLAELADGASSVETTIDRVLDLLVPAVADVCALDLVIDHEQVRLGARVAGGEGGELEQALLRRRPAPRSVGAGTAQALRVQQSLLMDPITDELLTAVAATPEDLARLRAAGLRAALFLPLVARSRLLGAVSLVVGRSGRRYHEPDLRFGELLAGRIGIVLDNAGLSAQALEAERRLAAALDALGEAVTINDRDGRTVYANRAAAALLKVEDPEDLYGGEVGAISAAFAIYDEAGAPVPISAMPAFRALAGEPDPEPLLVRNVVKATGEERWLLNKVTVLRDGAGEPERVVNVIEDVTAVKRAERHQRLLAESTRALSRSLDPQRTLQHVAETAVPELADWCGVDLPGPGGAVDLVAMAHVDPERVALGRELRARYPLRMDDPTDLVRAMTEGVVVEIPSIRDEEVEALALDAEHLRLLRAIGFGAILIVPLVADGRSLGAMTLVRSDPVRPFTAADRRLAEELGQRAGIAVLNSRLYADRARVAASSSAGWPAAPAHDGRARRRRRSTALRGASTRSAATSTTRSPPRRVDGRHRRRGGPGRARRLADRARALHHAGRRAADGRPARRRRPAQPHAARPGRAVPLHGRLPPAPPQGRRAGADLRLLRPPDARAPPRRRDDADRHGRAARRRLRRRPVDGDDDDPRRRRRARPLHGRGARHRGRGGALRRGPAHAPALRLGDRGGDGRGARRRGAPGLPARRAARRHRDGRPARRGRGRGAGRAARGRGVDRAGALSGPRRRAAAVRRRGR